MRVIETATEFDDVQRIVELIYQTDEYIYPEMCGGDKNVFSKMMQKLLKIDCIFALQNITLAKENGIIAGLVLAFTNRQNPPPIFDSTDKAYNDTIKTYFAPLLQKIPNDTLYINNVCVDKEFRRKGIAHALLTKVVQGTHQKSVILDCIAENDAAIALYQTFGFAIYDRFNGFTGQDRQQLDCVALAYKK